MDHQPITRRVLERLRVANTESAKGLAIAAGASQPTISRALSDLGDRVVRIGRGRSTRYALARAVGRLGTSWPIYQIDENSRVSTLGVLHALNGGNWWLDAVTPRPDWFDGEFRDGLFPDLPWFLDDLRPQGFMGRAFARQCSQDLGVNADPTRWTADDVLLALLQRGEDLLGNFVLGDAALDRAQRLMLNRPAGIPSGERSRVYGKLASAALAGEIVGSSAGGEQPKFTAAIVDNDHLIRRVIVKFSDLVTTPSGRRWADLLESEHLAARLLSGRGISSATTEVVYSGERCCLEVTRFDRVGIQGRVGCISLLPLAAAHYGSLDKWTEAADRLERDRWLSEEHANRLRLLWWFGSLIANSDMHLANTGLFLTRDRPFSLLPSYDMLPMHYRPTSTGEVVAREFLPPLPAPRALETWRRAADMAEEFWRTVEGSEQLSRSFRDIAGANAEEVARMRAHY